MQAFPKRRQRSGAVSGRRHRNAGRAGRTTVYELRLHSQDVGKVIGRQGMTINAIRSLLLAGSAKQGSVARWKCGR